MKRDARLETEMGCRERDGVEWWGSMAGCECMGNRKKVEQRSDGAPGFGDGNSRPKEMNSEEDRHCYQRPKKCQCIQDGEW